MVSVVVRCLMNPQPRGQSRHVTCRLVVHSLAGELVAQMPIHYPSDCVNSAEVQSVGRSAHADRGMVSSGLLFLSRLFS